MNTDYELRRTHERSALVHLMLVDGYRYIMCEVAEDDEDFTYVGSHPIYIITDYTISGEYFIDIEGNYYTAVQPIKSNGDIMNYDDYIKLKQLQEASNGILE